MGFLDKKSRVIDMVLTDYGRDLLSQGKLEFSFYTLHDDGVDYNPFIFESGSLSAEEQTSRKNDQIESSLVLEALPGYQKSSGKNGKDTINFNSFLFTVPQGNREFPEASIFSQDISSSLEAKQQSVAESSVVRDSEGRDIAVVEQTDLGFLVFYPTLNEIDVLSNQIENDGFTVRIFESGSDGLNEIKHKRDSENTVSYEDDLRLYFDDLADKVRAGKKGV